MENEVDQVVLEKIKFCVQQVLAPEFMCEVEIVDHLDWMYGNIVLMVRGYVWAEKESLKYQKIKYPRDWWQAFKKRWFPEWALVRWPVIYHVVELNVRALYPDIVQKVPDHEMRLAIFRNDAFTASNF